MNVESKTRAGIHSDIELTLIESWNQTLGNTNTVQNQFILYSSPFRKRVNHHSEVRKLYEGSNHN